LYIILKLESKLFQKFENDEVKNLSACVGGVNYITCNENCADEAGSKSASGVYDDLYESNDDCVTSVSSGNTGGSTRISQVRFSYTMMSF
jgi:hypothetical protein